MGMNETPSGERIHIGFFGRRNAGKSSLVNAVTGQDLSIVSEVRGTTTDPVSKSMELLPLGPVVIIDTPGIDDEGELGIKRVGKSRQVLNKTDLAITSGKLLPLSGETLTERKQTAPADAESLTAVEYRDRLYDLADRFAVLDIPMLIDRSADEADALAQADWLRLYGILFGNETTAERMIREITSREG